jgi:hypothetical protein
VENFRKNLQNKDISIRENDIPDFDLHQIFLEDPNGVTIELNFFGAASTM